MTNADMVATRGFYVFHAFAGVLDDLSIVDEEDWRAATNRHVQELVSRVEEEVYA